MPVFTLSYFLSIFHREHREPAVFTVDASKTQNENELDEKNTNSESVEEKYENDDHDDEDVFRRLKGQVIADRYLVGQKIGSGYAGRVCDGISIRCISHIDACLHQFPFHN